MNVIVIDLGKTNSKLALVDTAQAKEIQVVTQPAAVSTRALYPCIDHESIAAFIFNSLQQFARNHRVDAITVTTHGATAALLNANGDLALPVLDYEFRGVDESRHAYQSERPQFSATGSPALPGGLNIGAQLYWLQTNYPKQFSAVTTVLTWPQYWVYILTGEKHNDVTSLGCHTDLYEPRQQQYSTLVDAMHWRSLMPPTRNSGQLTGPVLPAVAKRTGLPSSTPVYTGIHDSNASLVPHVIARAAPFSVVSTGTWFITMSIGGKQIPLDENKDTLLNVNAHGDAVPSARFMGGRERDILGVRTATTEETLDKLLSHQNPPLLLPSVVPDTGPYPTASHHWVNAAEQTELRDCAVTLYLALMTNECLQLIGAEGPSYIEGPLAHDHHYAQMLSAVSDRPVLISDSQTGTSVGAAMLISTPDTTHEYTEEVLNQNRKKRMQDYAQQWQRLLQNHAK